MSNGELVTIYKASSDTNPGTYYEVRFNEDGTAKCECPSHIFQSAGNECKHIRRLRAQGLGFRAPVAATTVYQITHGDATVVVTYDHVDSGLREAVSNLLSNDELTVKRLV